MLIEKDTTLNFPWWYNNGTKEAFLMHVMAVLDGIKKHGHFKDYKEAQKAYVDQKEAVKSAKAGLTLLDGASKGLGKSNKKSKKAQEVKAKSKEANGVTEVPKDPMKANFPSQSWEGQESCQGRQGWDDCCCMPDVHVLCQSAFCWEQVHMEQDCRQADGKRPVCGSTRCLSRRLKGNVPWVLQQFRGVPPAHSVSHQRSRARKVTHSKCT